MRVSVDPTTLEPAGGAEFVAAIDNADDFCLDENAGFAYVTRHRANKYRARQRRLAEGPSRTAAFAPWNVTTPSQSWRWDLGREESIVASMPVATKRFDVVVLGGGPGGASTAIHCAAAGLETLLLERRPLPRDKVCSGMIMGRWAHEVIESGFGALPSEILADPKYLAGHRIHVPGVAPVDLPWRTPIAWRKNLDGWMLRRAVARGASVWDRSRVVSTEEDRAGFRLTVSRNRGEVTVTSRFLVGAEGASSPLRKSLFPELRARYSRPLRECYAGALALDRAWFHWFFPKGRPRPRFNVNHKDDAFILEGSGIRELRSEIVQILSPHGFDPTRVPRMRDGCLIAVLHAELVAGRFRPARGNALLVGDAAGLILPITFEGIGTAVLSGRFACEAIVGASSGRPPAAERYGNALRPIVRAIVRLVAVEEELGRRAEQGPSALADALADAYQETGRVQ